MSKDTYQRKSSDIEYKFICNQINNTDTNPECFIDNNQDNIFNILDETKSILMSSDFDHELNIEKKHDIVLKNNDYFIGDNECCVPVPYVNLIIDNNQDNIDNILDTLSDTILNTIVSTNHTNTIDKENGNEKRSTFKNVFHQIIFLLPVYQLNIYQWIMLIVQFLIIIFKLCVKGILN